MTLVYGIPVFLLLFALLKKSAVHRSQTLSPFVSIIIAARNEATVIGRCLSMLSHQDYADNKFEIIIVDDNSMDNTAEQAKKSAGNLSVTVLKAQRASNYKSSKKAALELAARSARGEILLFTDADCQPEKGWIRNMISFFDRETGLVAGFSPQTAPTLFWNEVLKIDAAAAALVAAGTVALGRGVTCTGRNLALRKAALEDIGGYSSLPDSLSGDDDFVLQKVSAHPAWKVRYAVDRRAVVPADGPDSLRQFLRQKRRHISAGRHFGRWAQMVFAVHHTANLFIWLGLVAAPFWGCVFLAPFALKLLLDYFAIRVFLGLYAMRPSAPALVSWQFIYLFYNVIIGPLSIFQKIGWDGQITAKKNRAKE